MRLFSDPLVTSPRTLTWFPRGTGAPLVAGLLLVAVGAGVVVGAATGRWGFVAVAAGLVVGLAGVAAIAVAYARS